MKIKRMQRLVLPVFVLILLSTAFAYAEGEESRDVADLNISIVQPVDLKFVYDKDYLYNAVRVDGMTLDEWKGWDWRSSLQIDAQTEGPGKGTVTVKGINDYTGALTIPTEFKFKPTKDELGEYLNLNVVNFDEGVPYTGKTRDPIKSWSMDLYQYSKALPKYNGGKWYKALREGVDYKLIATSYTGGKKVGKAKVSHTLRFIGDFDGTVTTSFSYNVVPKTPKVKKGVAGKGKITIKIAKQTTQTDGFKVLVFDRNKGSKLVKTKYFRSNKKTKLVIKGLRKGAWCDVHVFAYKTVGGKKYYSYYGHTKKVMKIK